MIAQFVEYEQTVLDGNASKFVDLQKSVLLKSANFQRRTSGLIFGAKF